FDALPRTLRGDAHGLVVVADRTARGEGVAEPEAVAARHVVGDVGEGRGALVGGDHQAAVVAVVAHHVPRGHRHAVDEVVGEVEQAGDEHAIARDALGLVRLAVHRGVAGRCGRTLDDEPALRAHRHDHRVLHRLRLDQAEHLGAEVLPAVRPAQTTTGDGTEPQVHTFDPRRADEDLVRGPRL